jgi:hypothetical protein
MKRKGTAGSFHIFPALGLNVAWKSVAKRKLVSPLTWSPLPDVSHFCFAWMLDHNVLPS